jgi:hypothetical protein
MRHLVRLCSMAIGAGVCALLVFELVAIVRLRRHVQGS